ncbi:MAG: YceI family protein [Actinomycetota bacterium]
MNIKKLAIGGGIAVVVLIAAVWWLFFSGDTPEAVDVDAANEQLDDDLAAAAEDEPTDDASTDDASTDDTSTDDADAVVEDEPAAPATPDPFDGDINATWVVDDEIGTFDFETASGSFAGFRVDEELTIGQVVAVGRTGGVSGTVTIEGDQLTGTDITVDMGSITSNDSRREFPIRNAVMATDFPTATFVLTEAVALPAGLAAGETVTVDATGELTVAGTTNEATFTINALVRDDGFGVITGSTTITWEDYGVTPPNAPIVLSIDESGIVEFQLIVTKG